MLSPQPEPSRVDPRVEPLKARRLYLLLRDRIASGELGPGDRLPGEPALAAQHGLSRSTVRRALDTLVADGLLTRRAGSGTFVRRRAVAAPVAADLANVFSHLVEMGRRTDVRLVSFAYGATPAAIAAALRLGPGERTQRSVRVRLIDGESFSYLTTYVPERIGIGYSEADLATTPLLALLERSGIVVERADQVVSAALAGPEVAAALGLTVGSPLLSLTRIVLDGAGRGVEHLHALYRPDRYSLQTDLLRTGEVGARRWTPARLEPANQDGAKPAEPVPSSITTAIAAGADR